MSSPVRHTHRRRSHSVSSPSPGPYSSNSHKWRISTKRARPSNPRSPSYHSLASDQPPRNGTSTCGGEASEPVGTRTDPEERCASLSYPVPSEERISTPRLAVAGLPCTSEAFELFPDRTKDRRALRRSSHRHEPMSIVDDERMVPDDLNRMRSDAFWELHRSVAESGEGLVQRMRDWETSRSGRAGSGRFHGGARYGHRPRGRSTRYSHSTINDAEAVEIPGPDEDDVEIVSNNSTSGSSHFHIRSPSYKKRALSLGMMDVDSPGIDMHPPYAEAEDSERCSSPIDAFSGPSVCSDDEELSHVDSDGIPYSGPIFTPALSQALTSSANSSLISLPLSLPLPSPDDTQQIPLASGFILMPQSVPSGHVPLVSTASRSEKAVAALTLAIANGAGGLNDYEALRTAEGVSAFDECQVGEMWH
ncbi:hypothetical protein B0H21DRAFT_383352 [Amylocystis lapponica]|nr:hypothetical protein B0H21DRAFT_383352 [Amylocystis lapponica]